MIDYINSWIPKIQLYSLKLDKLSKLYNQPWVIVDRTKDFIKIIFQEKGNLTVSINGTVSDGKWELLSVANSLLLEMNGERRLYNHGFLDNALMILKLDGFNSDFLVLANQNIIPDLDVENYLTLKYSNPAPTEKEPPKRLYEKEITLEDGRTLQIIKDLGFSGLSEVRINHKAVQDGFYWNSNRSFAYEIQDSKIVMEYYIEEFIQSNGTILEVGGNLICGITKGSPVWLEGKPAPDGKYKKGWFSNFHVLNHRIDK